MIEVTFYNNLRVMDNAVFASAMRKATVIAVAQTPSLETAQDIFRYLQLQRLHKELAMLGVPLVLRDEVEEDAASLLYDSSELTTKQGTPYKMFTPFYKACRQQKVRELIAKPAPQKAPYETEFPQLALPQWAQKLADVWSQDVREVVEGFAVEYYGLGRDFPSTNAVSRLSPYLAVGAVSPVQLYQRFGHNASFIRQLIWRDFAYYTQRYYPTLASEPLREQFAKFPYQRDVAIQRVWQRGETGYPLVDAGMHELYATGYMHNRVRMVCASFFTKHLLQPWQDGLHYFATHLVDYDEASNALNWQWVAGTGVDASPYFRVFNPTIQQKKFEADAYVAKWLPADYNAQAIVDHKTARERALRAYETIKGEN